VVATGNHYVLDVLGGAVLAEGAWWAAPLAGLRAPAAGLRRLAVLTGASRR
jgi:membrane-associated phospholipid phosphatase